MYDLIYNFILDNLFNSTSLECESTILGQVMTMNEWLSHSATIICICLIIAFLILFIKWIFKVVSGLLLLK